MTWLTKWSFTNKAAVGLLIVLALIVGVLSYTTLPMELMPEADNPQVTVTVLGPGQDAHSMETNVTKPIENATSLIKGKKEMFSTSGDGYAKVDLYFDSKTNMKEATQDVQKELDSLQFPQGVMKPFVLQLNTSMIPVSEVTIAFKDGLTENNIKEAENKIIPELQKIKGVANVGLYGKPAPQISVKVDPQKMAQKRVSHQQIMGILQGRNISASIGEQTIDGQTGNVNVTSTIDSVDTLKKLPVAAGVTLQDIATVELKEEHQSISRSNGKDVLFAVVTKEANANAVAVGNKVQEQVDAINKTVKNAAVSVLFSTSDMVVTSVNSMMREVLMGALFATLVILLFLRNFKATLITIVSIPLSLAITLYLLKMSGVTLNIITLGGVAVAVGRLVDDSIVVIENIYRRLQKEPFSREMIISATKEVARAITSSTITTVAVFLPMGLLRGGLQAFLLPFALTVTYSLLTSLVVALTVVPLLSSWLLRNSRMKEHRPAKRFASFLRWNLRYKWVTLSLALIVFVGSIAAYFAMPKGALDSSDAGYVAVQLKYPNDVPVQEVLDKGKQLEQDLMKQEQVKTVLLQSGNSTDGAKWGNVSSLTEVNYTVAMKDGANAQAFIDHVRAQKDNYAGATLTANETSFMGGSSTIEYIDVIGDDLTAITKIAEEVTAKVKTVDGIEKVNSSMDDTKPVFSFKVDPAEANAQEIAMQIGAMLNPMPLGQIDVNGNPTSVVMDPVLEPKTEKDLTGMTLMTATGPVPLSKLATFEVRNEPTMLYHKEGKTYVRISAEVDPKKVSVIGADIKKVTDQMKLPEGVSLFVGGASVDQAGDFSDIGMTGLISIGLVYLIMVLTFKTLRAPLAIMFSLPLAAIGAIIALIISGVNPDFTALFGALMLIGIVVTNAIVLIDRIKQNEERMTIREAIIEAASTRMRPILMTAIATICAMLPLVFGHPEQGSIVSQSLAIVVIGGLTAATLLTLVVVPAIYELFYFRKSAKQRKQAVQAEVNAA
ncbi:efflux RND transporter permease subunit [Paenibacillus sediminis]|uniref:Multidrug efflux pump subunit AcrB n=1 Tax=Paenibacillus sediminis TaxID=664909 RepID=A0ABS4H6E4_9BACL|nr:efflux RND transporter permease subunit [Paenibacillus sediminis]MBP1938094.1 multidrug efflux pump subunit AcrB [Paenibacillus sediminis]